MNATPARKGALTKWLKKWDLDPFADPNMPHDITASLFFHTPDEAFLREWVAVLRSGKHAQTQKCLRSGQKRDAAYCCLGLASDHALDPPITLKRDPVKDFNTFGFPTDEGVSHLTNAEFRTRTRLLVEQTRAFANMNDYIGLTFEQIADVIEYVYFDKALPK